jgi:hypothetical protein
MIITDFVPGSPCWLSASLRYIHASPNTSLASCMSEVVMVLR